MADDNNHRDSDNPLLKALPPHTDYLSYLTILEYNLSANQLPILHTILQDATLTANIGWDLVHLLLPLLPASQQCLQDVSRLGNPREVVLKVTELLEGLRDEDDEVQDDEEESGDDRAEEQGEERPKKLENLQSEDITVHAHGEDATRASTSPPSKAARFIALLQMLAVLHPRIKTKYPSRFLSTSLQAILPAYMQVARMPEATEVVLSFIKDLSGMKRPKLPPRKSSLAVSTQSMLQSAPDPEGQDEVLGTNEASLQIRLLQSFLTYVTEGYMTSLAADEEDVSGMGWCSRYHEKLLPNKIIPGKESTIKLFAEKEGLHMRDAILGQILALVRDLKIGAQEMLSVISKSDDVEEEDEELPSTASDVPLSRIGSVCLLAAMAASSTFFNAPASLSPLRLVPDFAAILGSALGDAATGSIGSEPESLIDAVLFLGFQIIKDENSLKYDNDEVCNNILQRLSLLSANTPSPVLRYNAHILTSTILHLHPEDHFRLAIIRDTLEHCPFENLKASAVGWLKDEFLAAARPPHPQESIFGTPAALSTLMPFLFPNINTLTEGQSSPDTYTTFQAYQPFYLAVLNLLYLLTVNAWLSTHSGLKDMIRDDPKYFSHFLNSLSNASRGFRTGILNGEIEHGDEEGKNSALAGLELLDMSVQQVEDAFRET